MQNVGPILALFNSPYVRRLEQDGLTGDRGKDLAELMNLIESGAIKEPYDQTNDEESDRDLQEVNPDILTTLTLIFKNSVFEVSSLALVPFNTSSFLSHISFVSPGKQTCTTRPVRARRDHYRHAT
jgi:hypothetical protein